MHQPSQSLSAGLPMPDHPGEVIKEPVVETAGLAIRSAEVMDSGNRNAGRGVGRNARRPVRRRSPAPAGTTARCDARGA